MIANPVTDFGPKETIAENLDKLKVINISKTNISSWEELVKLMQIPCLKDIRLKDTPLVEVRFIHFIKTIKPYVMI